MHSYDGMEEMKMTKEELALETVGRLNRYILMQAVPWTITRRGNFW